VREDFCLLEDQEATRHIRMEQLRAQMQAGVDRGAATPLDMQAVRVEGQRLRSQRSAAQAKAPKAGKR